MIVENTTITGVEVITTQPYVDNRGEFQEMFNSTDPTWRHWHIHQVSRSKSRKFVFRGLHLQEYMSKAMRVCKGKAFIYTVDLNPHSSTFLHTFTKLCKEGDNTLIRAPWWCARGFYAMEDDTEIEYFHDSPYYSTLSHAVNYRDKSLAIRLPNDMVILSENDSYAPSVAETVEKIRHSIESSMVPPFTRTLYGGTESLGKNPIISYIESIGRDR